MLVSVITPIYNAQAFLSQTIQSLQRQTFSDWEVILVDDCSIDNSLSLIRQYAEQDSRIKVVELSSNVGVAAARNIGIELARGRYIAFLDSDDLWSPNKLEIQLKFMQDNNIAFSYSSYMKMNEFGVVFDRMGIPKRVSYTDLLKTCVIGCLTAMYDTHKIGKVYMPTNTKREDFATWLMILKRIDYAYGIDEVLAQYRVYDNQNSAKKIKMAKENWRLYRDIEKLNLARSIYYFTHYAIRGLLRTKFPSLARFLGVLQ